MSTIGSTEIISIIKEEIENYDVISRDQEVGYVVSVGDGIASVYGIDHAMYGEIVTLETGLKGMVQDIKQNEISCILFGDDSDIKEGTKVARTGKMAGIPVGEAYIGRIVDALGSPIDGKGEIEAADYRPVEEEAPGIVERKSVAKFRWKQESFLLIPCFLLAGDSVSLSSVTARRVKRLLRWIPY